jgi:hypothetical protein
VNSELQTCITSRATPSPMLAPFASPPPSTSPSCDMREPIEGEERGRESEKIDWGWMSQDARQAYELAHSEMQHIKREQRAAQEREKERETGALRVEAKSACVRAELQGASLVSSCLEPLQQQLEMRCRLLEVQVANGITSEVRGHIRDELGHVWQVR